MEESSLFSSITRMIGELSTAIQKLQAPSQLVSGSSSSSPAPVGVPPPVLRAQGNLERLRMMLPWVRALLRDAEEREILDESVRLWLHQLKGVAYDADDILDEFEYRRLGLLADASAMAEADAELQGQLALRENCQQVVTQLAPKFSSLLRRFDQFSGRRRGSLLRRFDQISGGRRGWHLWILLGKVDELTMAIRALQRPSLSAVCKVQVELERLEENLRLFPTRALEKEILKEFIDELKGAADDAGDILDELKHLLPPILAYARAQPDARVLQMCTRRRELAQSSNSPIEIDDGLWVQLAPKIENVRSRFDAIYKQRKALRLTEEHGERRRVGAAGASARPPSSCFIDTPCFCGREEDKKKVIDGFLLSDQCLARNLSVIPIVGMGGVGKTTLAQHIYNDQEVSRHFDIQGWVCVSDDFELVTLTKRILEALTKKSHYLNEFSALQEVLRREIKGKRFLLVLDDLWNEKQDLWDRIQAPLHFGAGGSAVMATTRSDRVAVVIQTAPPLKLRCLSNEECWKIFQQCAFGGRGPGYSQALVEIGKKIVGKCKGLPLAVKALGGLLRSKTDVQSWEDILQSDLWDLDEQVDDVLSALRLSYLHLRTNLKQCFVYCAVFPKDYRFTKSQLVYMWIAQGFIQHGSRKQVEDIGSEYFEELLQRSFFQHCQDKQSSPYHKEHEEAYFVMHDLIHDLAQSISRGECFIIEHGRSQTLTIAEARHLSLVGSMAMPSPNMVADVPLRTLVILNLLFFSEKSSRLLTDMLLNLHCLRVLDLSHIPICVLPDTIENLVHLRYLNLSYTQIRMLPASVCKLYHLQTLLLTGCQWLQGLPEGIKNLTNLRNLPVFYEGSCGGKYCRAEELKVLVNLRGSPKIYRNNLLHKHFSDSGPDEFPDNDEGKHFNFSYDDVEDIFDSYDDGEDIFDGYDDVKDIFDIEHMMKSDDTYVVVASSSHTESRSSAMNDHEDNASHLSLDTGV